MIRSSRRARWAGDYSTWFDVIRLAHLEGSSWMLISTWFGELIMKARWAREARWAQFKFKVEPKNPRLRPAGRLRIFMGSGLLFYFNFLILSEPFSAPSEFLFLSVILWIPTKQRNSMRLENLKIPRLRPAGRPLLFFHVLELMGLKCFIFWFYPY